MKVKLLRLGGNFPQSSDLPFLSVVQENGWHMQRGTEARRIEKKEWRRKAKKECSKTQSGGKKKTWKLIGCSERKVRGGEEEEEEGGEKGRLGIAKLRLVQWE